MFCFVVFAHAYLSLAPFVEKTGLLDQIPFALVLKIIQLFLSLYLRSLFCTVDLFVCLCANTTVLISINL